MSGLIGMREVIPNSSLVEPFTEFNINTGGYESRLGDVKLPECSGGWVYSDQSSVLTRNRIVFWRTSHDVLELFESSLDVELRSCRVKYRFQGTPILSGVSVHETLHHVIILVSTVSSVHKLKFTHPKCLHKQDIANYYNSENGFPSIFFEANASTPVDQFHVIPGSGVAPLPHTAASWLDKDEEAIFALANPTEGITLVKLGSMKGIVTVNFLKASSYLGRLWDNLGGMLSSSRPGDGSEAVLSMVIHAIQNDVYIFALCKDHKVRMWLTSTHECVMVADVLCGQKQSQGQLLLGAQNHLLRKVEGSSADGFALAAFLCFSEHSQFIVFRPVRTDGQFSLRHIATIFSPEFDLIDFAVTEYGKIVALWTNPDGIPLLRYAKFSHTKGEKTGWQDVILEAQPEPTIVGSGIKRDPRQCYIKQLFYPGRFSVETLTKTLNIYRRSNDISMTPSNEQMSIQKLKDEVCAAVEVEVQNQINEYEISDEDHIAISHAAWARFYSCAIQYHESGSQPMGLILCTISNLLVLIKKESISLVRPLDTLEHLVLHDRSTGHELFHDTPILCEDPLLAQDVVNVMRAASLVRERITYEMEEEFIHSLYQLSSPDHVANKIVKEILTDDSDGENVSILSFVQELGSRLQQIGDVTRALEVLLYCLELDRGIVSHSQFDPNAELDIDDPRDRLFSSTKGRSVIAESLKQVVQIRFILTRDLIVLQQIMLSCGFQDEIPLGATEVIHSTFLPRCVVLNHSYFIISWINETNSTAPPSDSLEQGLRQMAILKISERNSGSQHAAEIARHYPRPLTLAELFLLGPGAKARLLLTNDSIGGSPWQTALMPLVNICAQLLWPRCTVPTFQEFLLTACQHMQIQEYVRLLSTWCDFNCHSRQFLLGSALLNMGEPEKACDWMVKGAGGVGSDPFLTSHLFSQDEIESFGDCTADQLTVMYFLKVINLFEQFGYHDHVIELAKTAIAICDEGDSNRTTLCYTLFSHHLKLGHYEKAYDAMVANPDKSRRKDSLRQFVVTLFERNQFKQLAYFPYIDMFEDLEQIIESRARSVDLSVNNYYDFLYSFHVSKENYRKAAYVMYECAMRIGTEMVSLAGLKQQVRCYLAALNALKLVNPDYAWIVKPVLKIMDSQSNLPPGVSPKHSHEGEIIVPPKLKPRLDVLEVKDIEREFLLIAARLKLTTSAFKKKKEPAITSPSISPSDVVTLLVSSNLFIEAIKVSHAYSLDHRPIVEGLASRCVHLSRAKPGEKDAAWDWLAENNHGESGAVTSVEAAWGLLKKLVEELETKGQTSLVKAVSLRLVSLGTSLPAWIVAKFKKENPAELLHIYLAHGFVLLASVLAVEYIEAALGNGKEYFGFKNALHATSPPIWLPFNLFDQLLLELKEHSEDPLYKKHYVKLNKALDHYLGEVKRVSQDMLTVGRLCI